MGGKSSTLSWLTAPLRWTPVSATEIMDASQTASSDVFARQASSASLNALNKTLAAGNDIFAARCMSFLFGRRAVTLPEPDSAGGYSSTLMHLLRANNDEFDDVVKNIIDSIDSNEPSEKEEEKESQTRFECLREDLSPPMRNYRILVLHVVRLLEQFCVIDTTSESTTTSSLLLPAPDRRELLCGMKLITHCSSYFMEVYHKTPQECLDFKSIAPTPDMAINMSSRLPSSIAVFIVRRAPYFRNFWDDNEEAESPGCQALVLMAQMVMCLTSLFATQMSQNPDAAADDSKLYDASFFYEALRCQNGVLVSHLVHLLLDGCLTFASIAAGASDANKTVKLGSGVPDTTLTESEGTEGQSASSEDTSDDRELSWFPNLFSIRPMSLGEAFFDVGASIFNIVAFPVKFIYQGAKAAFYTHSFGDVEFILPTVLADVFRRKDTATGALALTLSDVFAALLVVLLHPTASGSNAAFRDTLSALSDSHFPTDQAQSYTQQIDFPAVFNTLTDDKVSAVHAPLRMLILYYLLEGNRGFREYVYARTDCETLVLPLLSQIYSYLVSTNSSDSGSEPELDSGQHQYMVLLVTILHILSEDASFAKNIHTVSVNVRWFTEIYLPQTTLGGLLVLVLMRLMTNNLRRERDAFLHTSCVAILSNLAPYFMDLPALPSSRLVKFVDTIHRRCCLLKAESDDDQETLEIFKGFLQTHLKIVLSSVQCGLEHNPNIVYALLQDQNVFNTLAEDPDYVGLAKPLADVAAYFDKELKMGSPAAAATTSTAVAQPSVTVQAPSLLASAVTEGDIGVAAIDVEDVLRVVTVRAPSCRNAVGLVEAPLEEYKYAEDKETSWRFFETLSWRAVMWCRAVPFSTSLIKLFPVQPTRTAASSPDEPADSKQPSASTTSTTTTTTPATSSSSPTSSAAADVNNGDADDAIAEKLTMNEDERSSLSKGEANV